MARRAAERLEASSTRWYSLDELALRLAGSRIAAARKKAGLTQQALAEKLGVGQSEISRIENNPDHSTVRTLRKVAEALGVDVHALID